jgi:coproporphyrinogen III oxidase-like Fe-S oxidoreductase
VTLRVLDRQHGAEHHVRTSGPAEAIALKRALLAHEALEPYRQRQLYLHVPFCFFHCAFCVYKGELVAHRKQLEAFKAEIIREIVSLAPTVSDIEFETVFIGGGTVSVLPPGHLRSILDVLARNFRIRRSPDHEYTVEMAPQGFTPEKLEIIRNAGVNRLTMGIQSLDTVVLGHMNRPLVPLPALRTLLSRVSAAGFLDVNIDLMTAVPGRTWENLTADFAFFRESGCDSVMVYVDMREYRASPRTAVASESLELVRRLEQVESDQFVLNEGCGPDEYNRFRRIGRKPLPLRYSTRTDDPTILTVGLGRGARSFTRTLSFVAG